MRQPAADFYVLCITASDYPALYDDQRLDEIFRLIDHQIERLRQMFETPEFMRDELARIDAEDDRGIAGLDSAEFHTVKAGGHHIRDHDRLLQADSVRNAAEIHVRGADFDLVTERTVVSAERNPCYCKGPMRAISVLRAQAVFLEDGS